MQRKLQIATVRHVAAVSHVMLKGCSDVACRGFAHPEVCQDPDPLLLFGGQSKHNTYHRECSCTCKSQGCQSVQQGGYYQVLDMASFDCLVIAPMYS